MKNLIYIAVALLLALGTTGCASKTLDDYLVGTWKTTYPRRPNPKARITYYKDHRFLQKVWTPQGDTLTYTGTWQISPDSVYLETFWFDINNFEGKLDTVAYKEKIIKFSPEELILREERGLTLKWKKLASWER